MLKDLRVPRYKQTTNWKIKGFGYSLTLDRRRRIEFGQSLYQAQRIACSKSNKPSEKFPNAISSTQLNSILIDFEWFFFSFHLFPTFYQIQFPDLSKIFQNIPDDGSFLI
jgi:hypothetical protein